MQLPLAVLVDLFPLDGANGAVYHMLKNNVPFYDLGSDFYNKFNREKKICSYLNKLSELGYDLTAVTVSS